MPAGMFQKNLTCPLTITSFFLEYTGEMHIIALRRVFFFLNYHVNAWQNAYSSETDLVLLLSDLYDLSLSCWSA